MQTMHLLGAYLHTKFQRNWPSCYSSSYSMWDICDTFHVARASCVRQRAMHVRSAHSCVLHAVTEGQLFWQQDGAPPHFYKPARKWLNVYFQDRWIGRSPSHRSHRLAGSKPRPDSLQFPAVEWHKTTIVYREQPSSIDELKFQIRAAFEEISVDVRQSVIAEFDRRVRLCLQRNGDHIENVL